jgi:hypothetical protein
MSLILIIIGVCLIPTAFAIKNKKIRIVLLIIAIIIVLFAFGYRMGADRAAIDSLTN